MDLIVTDNPWSFNDKLEQSDVKRGAQSQYSTLSIKQLKELGVLLNSKLSPNSILAQWTPSSLLKDGMDLMADLGFSQKQTWIWVKTKKNPVEIDIKVHKGEDIDSYSARIKVEIESIDFNNGLAFGMGHMFRQCHELVLIGVKGKVIPEIKNNSQRSVHFWPATKHSVKPEGLQDRLDLMFPNARKIELFARRKRDGWECLGNECPGDGKDIFESVKIL